MKLNPYQEILLMLFRCLKLELKVQAALLSALDEKEQKLLVKWYLDYFEEKEDIPTETDLVNALLKIRHPERSETKQ